METITYKLEHFEGPLDLLLHLIEKNKIDIYDIPIVEITAQYLAYVRQMEREDLNIVSDFLSCCNPSGYQGQDASSEGSK